MKLKFFFIRIWIFIKSIFIMLADKLKNLTKKAAGFLTVKNNHKVFFSRTKPFFYILAASMILIIICSMVEIIFVKKNNEQTPSSADSVNETNEINEANETEEQFLNVINNNVIMINYSCEIEEIDEQLYRQAKEYYRADEKKKEGGNAYATPDKEKISSSEEEIQAAVSLKDDFDNIKMYKDPETQEIKHGVLNYTFELEDGTPLKRISSVDELKRFTDGSKNYVVLEGFSSGVDFEGSLTAVEEDVYIRSKKCYYN